MSNLECTSKIADQATKRGLSTFILASSAMIMLWLAFPPLGWSVFGWIAMAPLVYLIVKPDNNVRRETWQLWLAGLLYWLVTFYFIPIPHPLLWAGWVAISIYLACYLPALVLLSRSLARNLHVPFVLAIPASWVAMEFIRSYLLTGMGLVCLSHTQYRHPIVIQISDLSGAYTLSFAMAIVGTSLTLAILNFRRQRLNCLVYLAIAGIIIAGTLGYGTYRLNQFRHASDSSSTVRVVLVQGSIDTVFPKTEAEQIEFRDRKIAQYEELTANALKQWDRIDLIVWPENGWSVPDLHPFTDVAKMKRTDVELYRNASLYYWRRIFGVGGDAPYMFAGAITEDPVADRSFGAALCFAADGNIMGRYYKNHLVMFGEYIPGSSWIPGLQRIIRNLSAGTEPACWEISGIKFAPSICFESTVPQYIRRQFNKLAERGATPDVLVNMTNDGWFYGTSCLDFHLACNVFRAVEMRRPHLVCANTGLSAAIDADGTIRQQGPRRDTAIILTEVGKSTGSGFYRTIGDSIPLTFAAMAALATAICFVGRRSALQQQ